MKCVRIIYSWLVLHTVGGIDYKVGGTRKEIFLERERERAENIHQDRIIQIMIKLIEFFLNPRLIPL